MEAADGPWLAAACERLAAAASAVEDSCRLGAGPSQELEAAGVPSLWMAGAVCGPGVAGDAASRAAEACGEEAAACGPVAGDARAVAANLSRRGRDVTSLSWWCAHSRRHQAPTRRAAPGDQFRCHARWPARRHPCAGPS